MDLPSPDAVLDFWFGALDAGGRADDEHQKRWWRKDAALDASIRAGFGQLHAAIVRGDCESWLETISGRLGYVVVLDQFSRNMFRNSGRMFDGDERALAAAVGGIDRGLDKTLPLDQRCALYMPLMHSEHLEMQQRCLQLFTTYASELPAGAGRAMVEERVGYAVQHRDIVQRFGRFPHRNVLLGRTSTGEELEFLRQPGSSF